MTKYTKQQIIDMLKRNCIFDSDFGGETNEYGEFINLKSGIAMHIISDEEDYNMLCDLHKDFVKTIKGAIWTDIGLIYVAKMNEKGELELL